MGMERAFNHIAAYHLEKEDLTALKKVRQLQSDAGYIEGSYHLGRLLEQEGNARDALPLYLRARNLPQACEAALDILSTAPDVEEKPSIAQLLKSFETYRSTFNQELLSFLQMPEEKE